MPYKNKDKQQKYQKDWFQKNKKKSCQSRQTRRNKRRRWLEQYKSDKKCALCPENYGPCLDFHHKDPKTKKYSVSYMITSQFTIEQIQEEIKKCVLLCANCHRKLENGHTRLPPECVR